MELETSLDVDVFVSYASQRAGLRGGLNMLERESARQLVIWGLHCCVRNRHAYPARTLLIDACEVDLHKYLTLVRSGMVLPLETPCFANLTVPLH